MISRAKVKTSIPSNDKYKKPLGGFIEPGEYKKMIRKALYNPEAEDYEEYNTRKTKEQEQKKNLQSVKLIEDYFSDKEDGNHRVKYGVLYKRKKRKNLSTKANYQKKQIQDKLTHKTSQHKIQRNKIQPKSKSLQKKKSRRSKRRKRKSILLHLTKQKKQHNKSKKSRRKSKRTRRKIISLN